MGIISRKLQKIFAGNAINNGQFGSAQAGLGVNTSDIDVLQALSAFTEGWNNAIISGENLPTLEEMQGLQFMTTTQLAYLFQEGIAEYEVATEYRINSIVKKVGTYELYGSNIDDNIGNVLPVQVDDANWQYLGDLASLATPAGGGAWELISSATASASSSIDITSGLTSSYVKFMIVVDNMITSVDAAMWARISLDGGATWKSGVDDYSWCAADGRNGSGDDGSDSEIELTQLSATTTAGLPTSGHIGLSNMASSGGNVTKFITSDLSVDKYFYSKASGFYKTDKTVAINGVRILPDSGTITSGTFYLYGMKNT